MAQDWGIGGLGEGEGTFSVRPLKEKLQKGQDGPSSIEGSGGSDFTAEVGEVEWAKGGSSGSDFIRFVSSKSSSMSSI